MLKDTWEYLTCAINGNANDDSRGEIFGLNSYSWCGANDNFQTAGYDQIVSTFQSTSVPVFFSEYGCNVPTTQARFFNEVQALYGPQMTALNGGLVYEYTEETSRYGLVTLNGDGSITLLKDFDNLQSQLNKIDRSTVTQVPSINNPVKSCSPSLITSNMFNGSWSLPAQPSGAAALISAGVGGTKGKLVTVSNLTPTQKVTGTNGRAVTGLKLRVIDGSNFPSGASTSGGNAGNGTSSSSGSAPAATTTRASTASVFGISALACASGLLAFLAL